VNEPLTERIRDVWRDVLEVDDVPLDTNFFEVGGDSRRLVVLFERLSGLTDAPLNAADLFAHSTIQAQARLLAGAGQPDAAPTSDRAPDRDALLARRRATR
jgi:aryl carrier-like protein